jgi:hypothetical protein
MGRKKWTRTGKELQISGKLCVREERVLVAGGKEMKEKGRWTEEKVGGREERIDYRKIWKWVGRGRWRELGKGDGETRIIAEGQRIV